MIPPPSPDGHDAPPAAHPPDSNLTTWAEGDEGSGDEVDGEEVSTPPAGGGPVLEGFRAAGAASSSSAAASSGGSGSCPFGFGFGARLTPSPPSSPAAAMTVDDAAGCPFMASRASAPGCGAPPGYHPHRPPP